MLFMDDSYLAWISFRGSHQMASLTSTLGLSNFVTACRKGIQGGIALVSAERMMFCPTINV
jgi:hypothetical protein